MNEGSFGITLKIHPSGRALIEGGVCGCVCGCAHACAVLRQSLQTLNNAPIRMKDCKCKEGL